VDWPERADGSDAEQRGRTATADFTGLSPPVHKVVTGRGHDEGKEAVIMAMTYWQQARADFPRWCLRIWAAAVIIAAVVYLLSYTTPLSRLVYLGTVLFGVFTGLLYLGRLIRVRSWAGAAVMLALIGLASWVVFAGRPPDADRLRAAYVRRLLAFRGTAYVWGGETHVGVDCSGLARVALMEAMVSEGVREANPRLLGPMLWRFWWQDIGTKGMLSQAYGYTRPVFHPQKLAGYAPDDLQPGDLAVIGHMHVLMYIGDDRWIEANPDEHRVIVTTATPASSHPWFNLSGTHLRWWMLEDAGENETPRRPR